MIINRFNQMSDPEVMEHLLTAEGKTTIEIQDVNGIVRCIVTSLSGRHMFPNFADPNKVMKTVSVPLGIVRSRSQRPRDNERVFIDHRGTRTRHRPTYITNNSTNAHLYRGASDYVYAPNIPLQVTPILDNVGDDE